MANVLWLQGGACSGNTMSFLNAEEPTVVELITDFGLNILWHPTTGLQIGDQVQDLLRDIIAGKVQMDILVYEGSIIMGPDNCSLCSDIDSTGIYSLKNKNNTPINNIPTKCPKPQNNPTFQAFLFDSIAKGVTAAK